MNGVGVCPPLAHNHAISDRDSPWLGGIPESVYLLLILDVGPKSVVVPRVHAGGGVAALPFEGEEPRVGSADPCRRVGLERVDEAGDRGLG